jgi:chaperonin GroES
MKIVKPYGDRVLLRRLDSDERNSNSRLIVIPGTAKGKSKLGEIVAVGEGRKLDDGTILPIELKVGDKILFPQYGGTDLKINDETLVMLQVGEIYAKVEED